MQAVLLEFRFALNEPVTEELKPRAAHCAFSRTVNVRLRASFGKSRAANFSELYNRRFSSRRRGFGVLFFAEISRRFKAR